MGSLHKRKNEGLGARKLPGGYRYRTIFTLCLPFLVTSAAVTSSRPLPATLTTSPALSSLLGLHPDRQLTRTSPARRPGSQKWRGQPCAARVSHHQCLPPGGIQRPTERMSARETPGRENGAYQLAPRTIDTNIYAARSVHTCLTLPSCSGLWPCTARAAAGELAQCPRTLPAPCQPTRFDEVHHLAAAHAEAGRGNGVQPHACLHAAQLLHAGGAHLRGGGGRRGGGCWWGAGSA